MDQTGEWLQAMVVGDNMPFVRGMRTSQTAYLFSKKEGYVLEVEDIQKYTKSFFLLLADSITFSGLY
ncbi:MAG: hypothetical protein IPL23_22850 [Saprospiraceae bacterium]|nr:hypothetical protein [Saprospiraceae bacterium]